MAQPCVAVVGGTGQQGRGLAQRLALAGFPVIVASRDAERAAAAVAAWPASARPQRTDENGAAIAAADVVVLAIPFASADGILQEHQARFKRECLVIDVTVPVVVADGVLSLATVEEGSAAEHVRAKLPPHVGLAATFKTIPAHVLDDLGHPLDCDEFVCGDSAESRSRALGYVQAIEGLRAIDVGPLSRARALEQMTVLAIAINRRHKIRDARFKVIGL